MKIKILMLLTTVVQCSLTAFTASAHPDSGRQILTNGTFDVPQISARSYLYAADFNFVAGGWTFTNNSGVISPPGVQNEKTWDAPSPVSGRQIAFLQSGSDSAFWQVVSLPFDGVYELAYYDAGRWTPAYGCTGDVTYDVSLDSTRIINGAKTTTSQPFTLRLARFSARAGVATLKFAIRPSVPLDNAAFFDDIALSYVGPTSNEAHLTLS